MVSFNLEYVSIFIAIFFSFGLGLILFLVSFTAVTKKRDLEKNSSYECGFDPFENTRNKFDVRFYLVAILFIVFDLEVTFLFPWAIVLESISYFGLWSMFFFLFILTVGFVYEWNKGALDWE